MLIQKESKLSELNTNMKQGLRVLLIQKESKPYSTARIEPIGFESLVNTERIKT